MTALFSFGLGIGTQNNNSEWLEVFYPQPQLHPNATVSSVLASTLDYNGGNQAITLDTVALAKLAEAFTEIGESSNIATNLLSSLFWKLMMLLSQFLKGI